MAVEPSAVFPGGKLTHDGNDYEVVADIQSTVGTLTIVRGSSGVNIFSRDQLVEESALQQEAATDAAASGAAPPQAPDPTPQGQPQAPSVGAQPPSTVPPTSAANTPPEGTQ